jgi:hypothetical protein
MKQGVDLILSMLYFGRKYVFDKYNYELKDLQFKNNKEIKTIFSVLTQFLERLV